MSNKRKDIKGRVLRNGEGQRADGKYMFRYVDGNGERRTVYSWKLVETDKIPDGKRCKEALRTIEKRLLKDLDDGILTKTADNTTVNELFDSFLAIRTDLKETTRCGYISLYDKHVRNDFGRRRLSRVRYSDVYKLYMSLNKDSGLKVSSIQSINAILWQVFEIAVRDSLIRINPTGSAMRDAARCINEDRGQRHALTLGEQAAFLDYVYADDKYKRYAPLFTVLLGTGMRIGEALGLRWEDVDFKKGLIHVNHSLRYRDTEHGGYEYHISSTKTKAGVRDIPMFQDVKKALQKEKRRKKGANLPEFIVDGYSGFIFLNSAGKVYTPSFIFDTIQNIRVDYNNGETLRARAEGRDPLYLPKFSVHILRHTFCTRLCENEQNLKVIQEVMGHKNIRTTMDVYNEATAQTLQHSFSNLEGKIRLV